MSTGMGGPSTAIAVEELADLGVRYMIRIGSCGVMTEGIAVGDLILSQASCKNEGTSRTYQPIEIPAVPDYGLLKRCEESATELGFPCHVGITRSHDGIYAKEKKAIDAAYAPQGVLASDMETTALYVVGRLRGVKTVSILNVVARCAGDIFADIAEYGEQESMADLGEMREIKTALHVLAGLM
jgi:uridine phosphorylase